MGSTNGARPGQKEIVLHDGRPLADADPNGNRAQRRAAAKRGIKARPEPHIPDDDLPPNAGSAS